MDALRIVQRAGQQMDFIRHALVLVGERRAAARAEPPSHAGRRGKVCGLPAVKRNAVRGTEIQVAMGVDVARRQLSQWQWSVQFGAPSYENAIARQRQ